MRTLHNSPMVAVISVALFFASSNGATQSSGTPERCNVGNAMSVLQAFYPSIEAVNEFTIVNNEVVWISQRPGGLGEGVVNCQFRLFAAEAPFLPDTYEFCANDVFLGGNALSFPYAEPAAQAYLDAFYPDVNGSYRNKAIAELSRITDQVSLTRETYVDVDGNERLLGDGGPGDPALTDPTAGAPKAQEMIETSFRNFSSNDVKIVYKHVGFLAQLEAGTYWSTMTRVVDNIPVRVLPPVELVLLPCD